MQPLVTPSRVAIPQDQLNDLAQRLERTRWPDPSPVEDGGQAPPLAKLRALADHWRTS